MFSEQWAIVFTIMGSALRLQTTNRFFASGEDGGRGNNSLQTQIRYFNPFNKQSFAPTCSWDCCTHFWTRHSYILLLKAVPICSHVACLSILSDIYSNIHTVGLKKHWNTWRDCLPFYYCKRVLNLFYPSLHREGKIVFTDGCEMRRSISSAL